MDMKAFYQAIDGDYEDVLDSLMTEERIEKYVRMYCSNTYYEDLIYALEGKEYDRAFRVAHSMKGAALNLGFVPLQKSSQQLCDVLRNGTVTEDYNPYLKAVLEADEKIRTAFMAL